MTTFLTNQACDKAAYKEIISQVSAAIADSFVDDRAYSGPTPDELKKIIHQESILPQKGLGWDQVFNITKEKILPNLLRTPSTDYMAHLHGPSLVETLAAEAIISTFNQSMDSWDQSPVATEIEVEVINHLCKLYGYDDKSDGVFTSGGSQSNQTAIILARDCFCRDQLKYDIKKYGVNDKCLKLRMYTSEISHFSMEKSAHILGLGYQSVVKVPVDERKKMDIKALRALIEADKKAGNIPFLIVGTVGTTDFGSIDPLSELVQIARENNMWLHADYLNREEDEEDGYTNLVDKSLQTTRRFDALKVWISFQVRGKDGWAKLINTSMENALYLYEELSKDPDFQVLTKPEISSLVFRYCASKDADQINKNVRRKLIHEKGIVIGQTVSNGYTFLKFTLLNPLISHEKLDELKNLIKTLAKES